MKLTNKLGLPQTFINITEKKKYTATFNRFSVTSLIGAPKPNMLKQEHWDELESDVSDRILAMLGSGMHLLLEQGRDKENQVELKLEVPHGEFTISGIIDLLTFREDLNGWDIYDYKVTSAYSAMQEKEDWEIQVNLYRWMAEQKGYTIGDLGIIIVCRDWTAWRSKTEENYPKTPVLKIPINKWDDETVLAYLDERLKAHSEARTNYVMDSKLPDCTSVERWERPKSYAISLSGGRSTYRRFSTFEDAIDFVSDYGAKGTKKDVTITYNPPKNTKCEQYCDASKFCKQWEALSKDYSEKTYTFFNNSFYDFEAIKNCGHEGMFG